MQQSHVRRAALGLLRTYFYLVQHESDFPITKDTALSLIPARVTWEDFCLFSMRFDSISDDDVTRRYHYGEIRLSRLNFYVKFLTGKGYFHRLAPQYGAYFAQFYALLIFLFGLLSLMLSAFQLEIAVEQLDSTIPRYMFHRVSRIFTVVILFSVCVLAVAIGCIFLLKIDTEWRYALADRFLRRRDNHENHWKGKDGPEAEVGLDSAREPV